MEEVDPEPDAERLLLAECEERLLGAVIVEVGSAVGGRVRGREATLVKVGGHAEPRGVGYGVQRAALLVLEGLPLAKRVGLMVCKSESNNTISRRLINCVSREPETTTSLRSGADERGSG